MAGLDWAGVVNAVFNGANALMVAYAARQLRNVRVEVTGVRRDAAANHTN